MVDTERAANVQTLRALFSQQPVMGVLPSPKMSCPPSTTSESNGLSRESTPVCDYAISDSVVNAAVLQASDAKACMMSQNRSSPNIEKPPIKPKPTITQRSPTLNGPSAVRTMVAAIDREKLSSKSSSSSSICDNEGRLLENLKDQDCDSKEKTGSCESIVSRNGVKFVKLVKKETISTCTSDVQTDNHPETDFVSSSDDSLTNGDAQNSSVESEKNNMQRRALPPVDKLGPSPLKPSLPIEVEEKYRTLRMAKGPQPPPLPRRNTVEDIRPPERPTSIVPSRPSRPPPSVSTMRVPPSRPPPTPPVVSDTSNNNADVEELYGDTADIHQLERSNSLIPEFTEEDELGTPDTSAPSEIPSPPSHPPPSRPRLPPPPPPLSNKTSVPVAGQDDVHNISSNSSDQEIYEAIPADEQQEPQGPIYSNTKEQEKQQREQQKQMRREQKEREKRERESEKEKKKFGLTGEEVPIYVGCVKNDSRGGRNDLSVRKGEIVLILRIEKNPSGKWLAKNEKGKRGYVELTNIEVDADSVKSVMKSRMSQSSDDVYSDVKAEVPEEESVYESTF